MSAAVLTLATLPAEPPSGEQPFAGPQFSGELTEDAARLADLVAAAPRSDAAVRARAAFLARHAEAVYDALTDGRTRRVRLPELVRGAADRFPGLVPNARQMQAESELIQSEKAGHEIDQGVFCGALLRLPGPGRHLIETMLTPTVGASGLLERFRADDRVELPTVLVERHGEAGHITFRNVDRLNAEDNRLIADMETAVDLVLLDDRIRVGVLRGGAVRHPKYRGRRVFSAGINLTDLRNGDISFVDFLMARELGYIHKMQRGLLVDPAAATWHDRAVQKPWIGAVDTFAIGGGMQLLLVMDHVIAAEDSFLSLPAAEEGIVPGLGNLRLTRRVGAGTARHVILGGRRIEPGTPEGRLLCDEVVAADAVDQAVAEAVRRLAAPAVAANRQMLNLAEEPLDLYREYLAEFAPLQAARSYSRDVLEKVERRWQRSAARAEAGG